MAEALVDLGHQVDIAVGQTKFWERWLKKVPTPGQRFMHKIALPRVRWQDYDVVKISYQEGYRTLEKYGGSEHPFIISRLGTVVGPQDMDGIYFYGKKREQAYLTQQKMHQNSQYIALLNDSAKELWNKCFGPGDNILIVPGAADRVIPPPSKDPYPHKNMKRCIFSGNLFRRRFAPEANMVLIEKLNRLGAFLLDHDFHLYVLGGGDAQELDDRYVTYLGTVPYDGTWNFLHFAHVGIELMKVKSVIHNNESSKIYHYLRAGLPVVCEEGLPNSHMIKEANLGYVVENGNLELMAKKIVATANRDWNVDHAIEYILNKHTWDKRAQVYDNVFKKHFGDKR